MYFPEVIITHRDTLVLGLSEAFLQYQDGEIAASEEKEEEAEE